jgi:hypothetical protein
MNSYSALGHLYGLQYSGTIEPAAPFLQAPNDIITYIHDTSVALFDRYRALYYIRDSHDPILIIAMTELLRDNSICALMKHEVNQYKHK